VVAAIGLCDPVASLMTALTELVEAQRIFIYKGVWEEDEPDLVSVAEAVRQLKNPKWYRYRLNEDREERLSFGNVDNFNAAYYGVD
jgi:hypothetical protein